MALDPLTAIAGPESTFGTDLYNSGSSATGIFQNLSATWLQYAPQVGIDTSQYPTMASAPISDQFAVAALEYNQNGFSPWAPYDQTLANNIAAAGGASAYAAPGTLSTNPADYAYLDQPGALQTYFADNGATGISVTCTNCDPGTGAASSGSTIASAAAASGATAAAGSGSPFIPYSWTWQQYQTAIAQPLQNAIGQVESMASAPLQIIMVLSVMALGLMLWLGRMQLEDVKRRFISIAAVAAFVGANSTFYQQYVINLFNGLPNWFAATITGLSVTNPGSLFDQVGADMWAHISNTWWNIPKLSSTIFLNSAIIAVSIVLVYTALTLMFVVVIVTNILMQLVIVLGPLLMVGLLFDYTRGIFDRWIGSLITLSLVTLAADILASIFCGVIKSALNAVLVSGQPLSDVLQLFGVAIVTMILAGGMLFLPRLLEGIGGAAGAVGMSAAHQALGAAVYGPAGRAASAAAKGTARQAGRLLAG